MQGNKDIYYDNVNEILIKHIPEFKITYLDWLDVSDNGKLKHIVFMAFIDFLLLHKKDITGNFLERLIIFIDLMSISKDNQIQDLLHSEIFEFIEDNSDFKILLSKNSEELYYKNFK